MNKCLECGFESHFPGAMFCQVCGASISSKICINPNCPDEGKTEFPLTKNYCAFCGLEFVNTDD